MKYEVPMTLYVEADSPEQASFIAGQFEAVREFFAGSDLEDDLRRPGFPPSIDTDNLTWMHAGLTKTLAEAVERGEWGGVAIPSTRGIDGGMHEDEAARSGSLAGEAGQTMAEYGVVLAVITIAAVGVFLLLGDAITNAVQRVIDVMP